MQINIRPIKLSLVTAATLLSLSGQAMAERGDLSVGLKFGKALADEFDFPDASLKLAGDNGLGFSIGYEYDANWTAEFQYLTGEASGDEPGFTNVETETTSIALFAVYRTEQTLGSPYFMAKLGFGQSDVELTGNNQTISNDDSGLSFGAGIGYQFSDQLQFEIEYYRDSDVFAFALLSARYHLNN